MKTINLQHRLAKILAGFSSRNPQTSKFQACLTYQPPRNDFPVPQLVLFTLRDIMGFQCNGPAEKCAWWISCSFMGHAISFELRKFGFTICYEDHPTVDIKRIIGQLKTAISKVEKFLDPIAKSCVEAGHVTIENHYREFENRYRFFRTLADESYASSIALEQETSRPEDHSAEDLEKFTEQINKHTTLLLNGFYYSTAMIDAYFSRLEHQLILIRAFCGQPLAKKELVEFLTMKWGEKFKFLVNVKSNPAVQDCYARLKALKERIRNPLAHGGVENSGGSLYIHIPRIGALPATLTKIKNSPRFNFIPIVQEDYQTACSLFDKIDEIIFAGELARPQKLVTTQIDAAFDARSIEKYQKIISSDKETENYIDHWHQEWERYANMDY